MGDQILKRNTVRKKMSLREYINLMNYFQTGELEMDFSECDPTALSKTSVRVMRFNSDEKLKMDKFFNNNPFGVSIQSILDTVPKIKKQESPIAMSRPAIVSQEDPSAHKAAVITKDTAHAAEEIDVKNQDTPWLVDPNGKIEASNIDARVVIDIIKENGAPFEKIAEFFIDRDTSKDILLSDIDAFYTSGLIETKYTAGDSTMLNVMNVADKDYNRYQTIMNEPELTEEEQFERYSSYIYGLSYEKATAKIKDDIYSIDEVTSVSGDKIIADDDPEDFYIYEDAAQMKNDLIFLAYNKKFSPDKLVDIFGKKTSVNKKIKSLYTKYPSGMPGEGKFYHSQREAYEDGAIKI